MIVNGTLSEEQSKTSRHAFYRFSAWGALGSVCTGNGILTLLAIRQNMPDALAAMFGPITYLSYLAIPVGFLLSAQIGVGRSISILAMAGWLMFFPAAGTALLPPGPNAWIPLLFFSALAYFCQGGSVAMLFPFEKSITTEKTLPKMLSVNTMQTSAISLAASLAVSWYLHKLGNSLYALPTLLTVGACFGTASALAIRRIYEPARLQSLAGRPMIPQIRIALHDSLLRKQILVGCVLNLSLVILPPLNTLATKRGCGISESTVVILCAVQSLAAIGAALLCRNLTEHFGPRKVMLLAYPLLWIFTAFWVFTPKAYIQPFLPIPFLLVGVLTVFFSSSLGNYFMISIPFREQIGGTLLVFLLTGGAMGLLGMAINSVLFSIIHVLLPANASPLAPYRLFCLTAGLLLAPWIFLPASLPVKYKG